MPFEFNFLEIKKFRKLKASRFQDSESKNKIIERLMTKHTNDTTRILWIRPHGNYRTFTFITEISTNETLKKVLNTVFN